VRIEDTFFVDTTFFLVMEYCPKGDLGSLIERKRAENSKFMETVFCYVDVYI
jgi:serine/threonine protein kinase